jgi:hypothetical protein
VRARSTVAAVALAIAVAACGGEGGGGADPTTASTPDGVRWLAAVEVAQRADDLDAATQLLREPLGDALVVSPVDCFEGLPPEAGQGYVIGALADSSEVAEGLVAEAGEPLLFMASVTIVCPG